jgi:hypothetical protein
MSPTAVRSEIAQKPSANARTIAKDRTVSHGTPGPLVIGGEPERRLLVWSITA